jgi:vitamin B12 transporter
MKKMLFGVGAAILSAICSYSQSRNPNTDSIKAMVLDEVVVTANKFSQKQSQTGKVITVIDKATILANQGKNVSQLINETAGITVNGAQNTLGTIQVVYSRGASSGRTLVLIDGMPVYDPSLINNEFDLNFLAGGLIERIEVARGAQSTLYGSDAIGGVINIITKSGSKILKPMQVDAGVSYGSFNTTRSFANLYGKSGKWSYQAGYQYIGSDGFSAAHDKNKVGNFDKDGFRQHSGNARFTYHFSDQLSLSAFSNISSYQADIDASGFVDDRDFTNDTRNMQSGFVFDIKKSKWDVRVQYANNDVTRNLRNDSGHVSGFAKYLRDEYVGNSHFAEAYGNFRLTKFLTLLAGVDYRNASMTNDFLSVSSFGPFESSFQDTSVYLASLYSSLALEKGKFNMEAGFRLNDHEAFGNYTTFTVNPSFRVNQQWRVFGSIASGFKAPSLYQLFSFAGNPNLRAEKAYNYELGGAFTGKKGKIRLVGFYRDIENGIDFDYINFVYFNSGRQQVTGLEIEGDLQLGKKWVLKGNYTYLAAEERIQSRITNKDTTYNFLLKRPKHQAFASLNFMPSPKYTVGANILVVGERKDVGGFQRPDVSLAGYTLVGLTGTYQAVEKITIFIDIQNLFDKAFFDINGYNSMRRNIQGGIRFSL